jgi:hypothetical protein
MQMFPIMMIEDYSDRKNGGTIKRARASGSPYVCVSLPWEMIEPHEKQAQKNHSQSLARLAERGGLSADEALRVLENRDLDFSNDLLANNKLCRLVATWVDTQLKEISAPAET